MVRSVGGGSLAVTGLQQRDGNTEVPETRAFLGVGHVFWGTFKNHGICTTEFIIKHRIPRNFGRKRNLYLGRLFRKCRYHPYVTSQTFPAPLMSKLLPEMSSRVVRNLRDSVLAPK